MGEQVGTNQDIGQLKDTLGEGVKSVQEVKRPLDIPGGELLEKVTGIGHTGNVITTDSGQEFLTHKPRGTVGSGGNTVITDTANMSDNWHNNGESKDVSSSTVSNAIEAGGKEYNLLGSGKTGNCNDASENVQKTLK